VWVLALEPDDPASVGGYRLLARIGAGGMGTVYLGRSRTGRPVAVKLIDRAYVGERGYRDRFRREVQAARRVGGGFSAALLDADPDAETPWLVSEYLPALSLREAVRDFGPLSAAAVWMLAAGVAEALAAIHAAGIAHLDLKPANVLLTLDGPRVIDFGIARAADAATATQHTPIAGSAAYMSPEQAAGAEAGPASDIFSLGTTLTYASTGVEPYGDGLDYVKMYRIQHGAPRLDGISDLRLRVLVANLMVPDPAARPTATQLRGYLASVLPVEHRTWLPDRVVTEVQRRALEAANPPVTAARAQAASPPRRQVSRRALLLGGAGVGVAAIGIPVGWLALRPSAPPTPKPSPSPTPPPSPSPSAAATVRLEFFFTGNGSLSSLTYVVNGTTTTLRNVKLPWRKAIAVPERGIAGTWRLRYTVASGTAHFTVLRNGFELQFGGAGAGFPSATEDRRGSFDS
jgi:serine/threonine protein kinase